MIKIGILSLIIHRIWELSILFTQVPMNKLFANGVSFASMSSSLHILFFRCLLAYSIQAAFSLSCLCIVVIESTALLYCHMFLSWDIYTDKGLKGLLSPDSSHTTLIASPFLISEFSHSCRLEIRLGSTNPMCMAGAGSSNHLAWTGLNWAYTRRVA